jgi:hypothetical protein
MANSYLSKTPNAGNRRTWTLSLWFKRSGLTNGGLFVAGTSGGNEGTIRLEGDKVDWQEYNASNTTTEGQLLTNQLLRDTSAWYHLVCAWDSTNSTAGDRMKMYINGSRVTSFTNDNNPPLNYDSEINANDIHNIGRQSWNSSSYFDGYMSHVAFVDGQALAPTVFGEVDSTSGIWKFKQPSGVTWGNNGVHLKFENSGNLGLDSSGNSNTFTVNGNGRQAVDTPSNVYATMNSIVPSSSIVFSQGNNTITGSVSDNYSANNIASLGASSGKWYWEVKYTTANANVNPTVGIATMENYRADVNNTTETGYAVVRFDGEIQVNGSNAGSSYWGSNPVAGDIIMFALDMDNGKFYLGKNGTWENSGVPTSGSTGTGSITSSLSGTQAPCIRYLAAKFDTNFGNGYFGITAISSAGSNGNGSLFEYDVPSGYYALNTKNINTYG